MNTFLRFVLPFALLSGLVVGQANGAAAQKGVTSTGAKSPDTYLVPCDDENKTNRVTGRVSVYGKWRAYVEVSVQAGCLYTKRIEHSHPAKQGRRLL